MPWSLMNAYLLLPGFALVLFRVAGLLLVAPVIGSQTIPRRMRVALAMTMAVVIFPIVAPTIPAEITIQTALVGVAGELAIGLVIGLGVTLIIVGVQTAGMMIGQQAGIALASAFDPSQGTTTTVVGQVYMITTTLIFLILGGHRMLVRALLDTFGVVPVMSYRVELSTLTLMADLLSAAYILAIRLFAPILIALLLTTLTMAFVSRSMPQLNILSVGFALRGMVALGTAAVALGASQDLLVDALLSTLAAVRRAFDLAPLDVG